LTAAKAWGVNHNLYHPPTMAMLANHFAAASDMAKRMLESDGERFSEERRKERIETLGIVYSTIERYIRRRCSDFWTMWPLGA